MNTLSRDSLELAKQVGNKLEDRVKLLTNLELEISNLRGQINKFTEWITGFETKQTVSAEERQEFVNNGNKCEEFRQCLNSLSRKVQARKL